MLSLIDSVASKLDLNEKNKILTDRQLKHAQIKLAQLRCEITQSMLKEEPNKPVLVTELSVIQEENKGDEEEEEARKCSNCCCQSTLADDVFSEQLISNLIENVKLDANLNEDKAIIVANSVIKTLSENIEPWTSNCKKILGRFRCVLADSSIIWLL